MDTKALIEIAEYLKSESVANELRKLDQRLQDSNVALTLPLVGEFSSGKTSLINALTDSKQLEIATKPTTATIYLLHFGQDRQYATIHRADGSEETVEAIGSLKNSELADVPLVDIYDTSTRVPRDLVLVDTPGLSSPDARHKDALIGFLPKADAILMAVDCNQQITHSLLRFVEETKLAGRKVYLIVTKCDTKPVSDQEVHRRKQQAADGAHCVRVGTTGRPHRVLRPHRQALPKQEGNFGCRRSCAVGSPEGGAEEKRQRIAETAELYRRT